MAGTQEKIELLKKIAHRFHAAQIEWALGASMMLYFKGLSPAFHDIDLMVSEQDAERAGAILSEMGKLCPPSREGIRHDRKFLRAAQKRAAISARISVHGAHQAGTP